MESEKDAAAETLTIKHDLRRNVTQNVKQRIISSRFDSRNTRVFVDSVCLREDFSSRVTHC